MDDPNYFVSTWPQRAWLLCGCISVFTSFAKAITGATISNIWLEPILAGLLGYILADLASGIIHWVFDNYGDADTPFFGYLINVFLRHHERPSVTTKNQFANRNYYPAKGAAFIVLPIVFASNDPTIHAFVGTFFACLMFSLQFHAWAHTVKNQLPGLVVILQGIRLLVSPAKHALHHEAPYSKNYCMVSGVWDEPLDKLSVFKVMEMILFRMISVKPRSWNQNN